MGGKKDFYSIADLSKDFAEWEDEDFGRDGWSEVLRLYHAKFTLAMAQQLTVIAGRLGELIEAMKETESRIQEEMNGDD